MQASFGDDTAITLHLRQHGSALYASMRCSCRHRRLTAQYAVLKETDSLLLSTAGLDIVKPCVYWNCFAVSMKGIARLNRTGISSDVIS